jgi:hypothetical protein
VSERWASPAQEVFQTDHFLADSGTMRDMPNPDSNSVSTCDGSLPGRAKSRSAAKIGMGLILLSGVLWFSLFAIPFLPLSVGQKAALAGVDFVGVQIAWWTGATLAGPKTVAWLKSLCRRSKRAGEP